MSKKESGRPSVAPLSRKKLFWFRISALLIPVLILFLLEGALRLFHYGYRTDLFIGYAGDDRYLVMNPDASKKYFSDQAAATTGNAEPFKKEKDNNTLRIFILGESTTIGYPYFHNASFHRWLRYRLEHSLPDKNLEIINCALTAVNSYTVLGFARQVVNYEPDAVFIYTGHNEYYGALGVGSTDRAGGSPAVVRMILWLRQFRLVQWLSNSYEKIAGLFRSGKSNSGKTRMELMVADQQIPYESALFDRGVDQFKTNMDATLNCLSSHHIQVFISNLVSNEKDLRPFISLPVDSIRYPHFLSDYRSGLTAFENGKFADATLYLNRAGQTCPWHAGCNYYLGCLAYQAGDSARAEAYFSKARDLDALRFRAPHQFNEIIAGLCSKYPDTHLVDTRSEFRNWCREHIIGDELLLEHVHPNLRGYAVMSDAFYQSIKKAGLISIPPEREMSFAQLLQCMPVTVIDSLSGAIRIGRLKKSWPFDEVQESGTALTDSTTIASEEGKLANATITKTMGWLKAMEALYDLYIFRHDLVNARTVVEALTLEYPQEEGYYEKAANLSGELKDDEEAVFYFGKAFALAPSVDKARYVFVLCLKLDRPSEAIPYIDYAIRNGNADKLTPIRDLTKQIIGLESARAKDSSNPDILNGIAERYARMGNRETAVIYLNKVLRADPKNKTALTRLNQVQNRQTDAGH